MPGSNEERSNTLRRVAAIAFGLYVLFVVAVTLWPFDFSPDAASVAAKWAETEWYLLYYDEQGRLIIDHDLVLNIVFFIPLGAAWGLAGRRRRWWRIALGALSVGLALSVLVEGLQLLTPERSTQIADVWRNALGAALGGLYAGWLRRSAYSEGSAASGAGDGS